jgi:hypothetical protein
MATGKREERLTELTPDPSGSNPARPTSEDRVVSNTCL